MKTALPLLLLLATTRALAQGVEVRFETTQPTVWGESVYVLGDVPALGDSDPTRALRLRAIGPHRWRLDVALPAGQRYQFIYLVRDNAPRALGARDNARWVSGVQQGQAGQPADRRVRVRYLSGFQAPSLVFERAPGRWEEAPMRRAGAGRGAGESLWEVEVLAQGPSLQLHARDGARKDLAPGGGVYRTTRADLVLCDGQVLPDLPPAARSRSRVQVVRSWYSRHLGNARDISIYLPRDYDGSTRRYPVLYMHDGQNLFGHDAFMGGWRVEEAADRLIAAGRVEDLIIVGVANTPDRMREYMPPEERGRRGRADLYGRFLVEELKPWVDGWLRTRPGREDTGLAGSSLGGLVSFYLGWERSDVFGRVGSLSGSFWLSDHLQTCALDGKRDLRVWLDSGTAGESGDSYEDTVAARDLLLAKGFVLGRDLQHAVDLGAGHDERAWRGRVGAALEYLFPAR